TSLLLVSDCAMSGVLTTPDDSTSSSSTISLETQESTFRSVATWTPTPRSLTLDKLARFVARASFQLPAVATRQWTAITSLHALASPINSSQTPCYVVAQESFMA